MTTRTTSTGHTLTHLSHQPLWLHIGGETETMQDIPDAEIEAFARELGLEWRGDVADESTLKLAIPEGKIAALRAEASKAGDLDQVRVCDEAAEGDRHAILECAKALVEAKAQEVRS